MVTRRRFLVGTGSALVLAGVAGPRTLRAATPPRWAPYANTFAIDAAGGISRPDDPDEDHLGPASLADAMASGLTAVVLTIAPNGPFRFGSDAFETAIRTIARWDREVEQHPELRLIRSGADLVAAKRDRRFGLVYGFQETSPIGEDIDRIEMFHSLGVRVIQLTHNRRNLVGDGCMEPGNAGLSEFGHRVIEALNAQKIVIDCAHGGERMTREAIAASKAPPLISHTGCRALSDLPRCTTDANLKAMADKGGVAGIIFWPYLRKNGQPMAEDLIRHVEHAIDVCGEDHVGLGSDASISAVDRTPQFEKENREFIKDLFEQGIFEAGRSQDLYLFIPDLNTADRFETIGALLSRRGHSDARIAKVLGGNFARVMGEIWG